jgi:hypothetical protein
LRSLAAIAAVASPGAALLATPAQAAAEPPPQFYSNGKLLTTTPVQVTLWGEVTLPVEGLGGLTCQDLMSGAVWNEHGEGVGQIEAFAAVSGCKYRPPAGVESFPHPASDTGELPFAAEKREAEVCSEATKTEMTQCPGSQERKVEVLPLRLRRRAASLPWNLRLTREVREEEPAVVAEIGRTTGGETCYPKEVVEGKEVAAQWEKVPPGCIRINRLGVASTGVVVNEDVLYGSLKPVLVSGAGNGLNASRLELNSAAGQLAAGGNTTPQYATTGVIELTGTEARELISAH